MNKHLWGYGILILIIGVLIGYAIQPSIETAPSPDTSSTGSSLPDLAEESPEEEPANPQTGLLGVVQEVSGNTFTIQNPENEELFQVSTNGNTKVTELRGPNPDTLSEDSTATINFVESSIATIQPNDTLRIVVLASEVESQSSLTAIHIYKESFE